MDDLEQFRALLRERLKERGALARLARASGLSSPVIGHWARGETSPTHKNLKRLAPALGIPYDDLMKMCRYIDGEAQELISAQRESFHAELDGWINAIGPKYEQMFLDDIKNRAASNIALIRQIDTAVSDAPHTAVIDDVSEESVGDLDQQLDASSPLNTDQHPVGRPTSVGRRAPGRRVLANAA